MSKFANPRQLREALTKTILGSPRPLSGAQIIDIFPKEDEQEIKAAVLRAVSYGEINWRPDRRYDGDFT